MLLKAPFPWFGGKSLASQIIWEHLGDPKNYVEPFAGSLAVLLNRPSPTTNSLRIETVNDIDGYVVNFWRAVKNDPWGVASFADNPVHECDLTARHLWLVNNCTDLPNRLSADPDFFDIKVAGWWAWGASCWVGTGWCTSTGPWRNLDGVLVKDTDNGAKNGVTRKIPHLGDAGTGVVKKLPHLGDAGKGVTRQIPHLGDAGVGVTRQIPHLGNAGKGVAKFRGTENPFEPSEGLLAWFNAFALRLRNVRVCQGDWKRVCSFSVTANHGLTGVLLDPPYLDHDCEQGIYANGRSSPAKECYDWAVERGNDPLMRIAFCCYDGHFPLPEGWFQRRWKANGGYSRKNGRGATNSKREVIMFSPHCLKTQSLLEEVIQ